MRAWLLLCLLVACDVDDAFHCVEDDACGGGGVCEANGSCSFEDEKCASGRRYGAHAPRGIADVCVPAPVDEGESCSDAGSCAACQQCAIAELGPCAPDLVSCESDPGCSTALTCTSLCVEDGVCSDCCVALPKEVTSTISMLTECVVAECDDLCGPGATPQCTVE